MGTLYDTGADPKLQPRFALVIATTTYDNDSQLERLRAPATDAVALAATLADPTIGAFEVTSVVDQKSNDVRLAIEDFLSSRTRDELVVLYLSCHGVTDSHRRLHFGTTDTNRNRLHSTAVDSRWVHDRLEECRASSQILILDCCFSGAFARGAKGAAAVGLDRLTDPSRGRVVLTASNATEYSFETPTSEPSASGAPVTSSVFTAALLDGLRDGRADENGDGVVTVDEAYTYAFKQVRASGAAQTPQRWMYGGQGTLVLARNPTISANPRGLTRQIEMRLQAPRPDMRIAAVDELGMWLHSGDAARVTTALNELRSVAENDIPRVAAAARKALESTRHTAHADAPPREDRRTRPNDPGGDRVSSRPRMAADDQQTPPSGPSARTSPPRRHWINDRSDRTLPTTRRSVGIDLGTTKSLIAVLEGGQPTIISNTEGSTTTPSVVAFAHSGEVLVGEAAKRQAVTNVDRTIRSVKRHMGTDWTVTIDNQTYSPQQISAYLLQKLKWDAEVYLGERLTSAVITVPAHFSEAERHATKEAAELAGLSVDRIINEPIAAALTYGLDRSEQEQIILVFDLGGGTLNVSLLEIGDGVLEVKATNGDGRLGGDDWDARIVDWLMTQFNNKTGVDLSQDSTARQRLQEAAEKAKIELSSVGETSISLPYLTVADSNPLHLDETLTRSEFQRLTFDLLDRCRRPFLAIMKDAWINVGKVDHVILVGGSTRMPAVVDLVKELTGGREPFRGVNREEVVVLGASLQAGVLKAEVKDVLLLDVTPLTLGIETKGGVMTKIIERNTTIPTKRSEVFSTVTDGVSSVTIYIYQGEKETARDNLFLGEISVTGLTPKGGVPRLEIAFDIDSNGIVHVHAKDLTTGAEQTIESSFTPGQHDGKPGADVAHSPLALAPPEAHKLD